ncbi:type II toxin-antitoxin system VapC family toxin [Deltaproteobacteria bacterium TL4]
MHWKKTQALFSSRLVFQSVFSSDHSVGQQATGGILKARVYIETSVISYLTARPTNDIRAAANQNVTLEWWETQRPKFDLLISEFVVAEASLGHPEAAERRLAIIADIMELQATEEVRVLGQELIRRNALPAKAEIDAYHVAIAAVNGIEYLLTWNCAHIAKPILGQQLKPPVEHLATSHLLFAHRKN